MIGGGPFRVAPGEWTDDTAMASAILRVAATGSLDLDKVGAGFLEWFAGRPKDVGNQTRAVLGAAGAPGELAAVSAARFARHPRGSAGNGSLMRTGPVALAHLGDDQALAAAARAVSDLTHGDPLAGDACVLWCIAIDRAVREARLDGIDDGLALLPPERRHTWADLLQQARTRPPETFVPNGFVVTALQAALAAIHHTPVPADQPCRHLRDALVAAVRIGDDTDTVAAIAGALLGARWGGSAVPLRWRSMLHGWPGWDATDLVEHAVLAAQGGQPDPHGWPGVDSLLPHYRAGWPSTPILEPLASDPGVLVGNVFSLEHVTEVDHVVSLCRIGAADVPLGARGHPIHLIDRPDENPNLAFQLLDLADTIATWRDADQRVLIHCVAAESRTPTVAAAYLAHRHGLSGHQALADVGTTLPTSNPNAEFRSTLAALWP